VTLHVPRTANPAFTPQKQVFDEFFDNSGGFAALWILFYDDLLVVRPRRGRS
jgi:hypothetical protein